MTNIKARLDEIAKEAYVNWFAGAPMSVEEAIRAAIDKALEVVLTAEPSLDTLRAGRSALRKRHDKNPQLSGPMTSLRMAQKAMSSALLEELKK